MPEAALSPAASSAPTLGQGAPAPEAPKPAAAPGVRPITPETEKRAAKRANDLGFTPNKDNDDIPVLDRDPKTGKFLSRAAKDDEIEREVFGEEHDRQAATSMPGEAPKPSGAEPKPALPPGTPELPKQIEFGGRKYATADEALQAGRSLHGQFANLQQQIRALTDDRDYGWRAANAWQQKYEQEIASVRAPGSGAAPAGSGGKVAGGSALAASAPGASGSLNVDEIAQSIDTGAFESLAAHVGLPQAGQYLIRETLKAVSDKLLPALKQELMGTIQPLQASYESAELESHVDTLFQQVGALKLHTGARAFPEVDDEQTMTEVGRLWRESGMDPRLILSANGLMTAIGYARMVKGWAGPAEIANPTATPLPGSAASAPVALGQPPAGIAASAGADGPGGTPPSDGRPNPNLSASQNRLASLLSRVDMQDAKDLGFRRNPRVR